MSSLHTGTDMVKPMHESTHTRALWILVHMQTQCHTIANETQRLFIHKQHDHKYLCVVSADRMKTSLSLPWPQTSDPEATICVATQVSRQGNETFA